MKLCYTLKKCISVSSCKIQNDSLLYIMSKKEADLTVFYEHNNNLYIIFLKKERKLRCVSKRNAEE